MSDLPTVAVTLTINDEDHDLVLDARTTVLDALREHLDLVGAKKGCDHGQCGACTVLVDGRRELACLLLAASAEGSAITTIEGVAATGSARGGGDHPLQRAFLEHDAYQCGYCTPGQICSAIGMLREVRDGWPSHATEDVAAGVGFGVVLDEEEVRERMSGNLCRCGAYANIVPAILDAADAELEVP